MTVLGQWVVIAALVSSAASAYSYARAVSKKSGVLTLPRWFTAIAAACLVVASGFLTLLFLNHDFSNGYVFSYSDRSLPVHYLVSCFYAGQEGSFLFWALCSAIIALVLMRSTMRRGSEAGVMTVFMCLQTLLLLLVVAKSPFRSIWDMFPGAPPFRIPADGRGLNPLLQNFWMVIHPPVLFIGFAAMAVPFSIALSGLWTRTYSILPRQAFPWVLFATSVLGVGIMLGAYWAYGVLGWGGYWGWDPVENSSLIPWLVGMALLHTLLAQLRTSRYVKTNFALALLSFVLVVYSTFLTRSGILGDASVHSFTDPGALVYWLLLVVLLLIGFAGLVLFGLRWKDLRASGAGAPLLTRESSLYAGSISLMLSAAVVLFGTSLPIFSTSRVDGTFYDTLNLPVVIAIALLIGLSLVMQWGMQDRRQTLMRSTRSLAIALVLTLGAFVAGARDGTALGVLFALFFAISINVEIGLKIIRGDPFFLGGKIAHIGVAVLLLGVICTGRFGSSQQIGLPLHVPSRVLGRTLTYMGSRQAPGGKVSFEVSVEGEGPSMVLSPTMLNTGEQGNLRNPDIASTFTHDFYISPLSVGQPATGGRETYTLRRGDTVAIGDVMATFVSFDMSGHGEEAMEGGGGMVVGSVLALTDGHERETITPVAIYRQGAPPQYRSTASKLMNANVELLAMNVGTASAGSTVTVGVERQDTASRPPEVLYVEASVKPFISLIWTGTILMTCGFVLSIVKRSREA